jgi:predicted MPP superfamily phosphohydrolase
LIPALLGAVLVLIVAIVAVARREARRLHVRAIRLDFDRLPTAFDGYRIVLASDFHVRRVGGFERKVLAALGGLRGDLLVLGGDFQNHHKRPVGEATAFVDALAALAPNFTDGILAVRGNHDSVAMRRYLKEQPAIRYLSRSIHVIEREGAPMAFAGARTKPRKKRKRLKEATRKIAAAMPAGGAFRVLIAHWPDYFPPARRQGFDLVLSGDTHGGQIRLPAIGPIIRKTSLPKRYAYGLVREGGTTLYTTSGVGTRMAPLRLFCPPEIVVFELHRKVRVEKTEDTGA